MRPPLSPVARSSPSWLNSTVETISAENQTDANKYNEHLSKMIQNEQILGFKKQNLYIRTSSISVTTVSL